MNLLIVIPYFHPAVEFGGPATVTHNLATWLVNNNVNVTILTTDAQNPSSKKNLPKKEVIEGIEVHRLKNLSNTLAYNLRLFMPIEGYRKVGKLVKWADVIHFQDLFSPLHLITRFYANKYKKSYVVSPHGTLDSVRLKNRSFAKRLFWHLGIKNLLLESQIVHALNNEESQEIKSALENRQNKIVVIPNAVSEIKTSKQKGGLFRKNYGIANKDSVLSYLGRVDKQKGLGKLIDIFSETLKKKKNAHLVIAGPNYNLLSQLKQQSKRLGIKNRVKFIGTIEEDGKESLFSATDIFVYPSPSEGFSVAILEALSAGIPVVITKECKFEEVNKTKAGFVANSYSHFEKSLIKLLENRSVLKKMGKNAKKLSKSFTWKKIGPQYRSLYARLM